MAESLDTVYDALLMDHIRSARNYGLSTAPSDAETAGRVAISNPLCGDVLELELDWNGDRLDAVRFGCECCGIAMGSASLMTTVLAGQQRETLRSLAQHALALLRGACTPDETGAAGVDVPVAAANWRLLHEIGQRLPARRTCASLGWQALLAGLDGERHCNAKEIRP